MRQLIHNGVLLPKYEFKGFRVLFRGKPIELTSEQEEMAVAWARKQGTPYVEDAKFVRNFFRDFARALGFERDVNPSDFDFSEIVQWVEGEKAAKETMSREERRRLAEERRKIREANREKYGYAVVDGRRVEVSNYTVEPACIFIGRGKTPLRGRWKRPIRQEEITLNLSPDAPVPEGNWRKIVWQPDSMWIAKWDDPLRGKEKYVWIADTAPLKQKREKEKFDYARQLGGKIEKLRSHIQANLVNEDLRRRKIATVCYLIDALKIRVGDEKDRDEADTVGATTLRRKHVTFLDDGSVLFNFLGKDSVRFKRALKPPPEVLENLREFARTANSSLFNGVRSDKVSAFLSEVAEGFSAKVFRTYHATEAVKNFLSEAKVSPNDPEWKKREALTIANLQAAILLNHKRALPKNFQKTLEKREKRLRELKAKKKRTEKHIEAIERLRSKIKMMRETRNYNLRTSLKSYIDPRVIYRWCKKIGYDWREYYPKTLQRKFEWVEEA